MADQITRRDFINGVAIAIAGVAAADGRVARGEAASGTLASAAANPPALTGLRGSHPGSFETAHRLRDGASFDTTSLPVNDRYDLVVVGAGISGLAAAYYYRKQRPDARVLILDTNDDFGGHAKRNEFEVDGQHLLGYGGTQSIDSPRRKWSAVARALLTDLDIDVRRFNRAFDQSFYDHWKLRRGVFFKKEVFGADRLVVRRSGKWNDSNEAGGDAHSVAQYVGEMPLNERARQQLSALYLSKRDVLQGKSPLERQHILDHTSYRDFLKTYWEADDDVLKFLQTRTHGLWAIGIDAVPASFTLDLPGLQAQRHQVKGEGNEAEEPYIYHFPDGNASIARMLVRRLIPGCAAGSTMEDIVTARFDYAQLDRAEHAVQLRLGATAVSALNVPGGVELAYVQAAQLTKIAARDCVFACYQAMMPYLSSDIGADQATALHANVRAPLVYVNVALRNWQAWHKLGVAYIANPGGLFEAYLDFPVSIGNYRFSSDPSQPIVAHLEYMPTAPNTGLDMRAQYRAGRAKLYAMSFADFEREIRDELSRMLGAGGFDFDRDVAALTVNRWPHGYAYTPTPLYDNPKEQANIEETARRRVGRIAIANSDAGWDAYTHVAIDQAHRAVMELLG